MAFCNPWDFFFTGTLDPSKYDRSDLDSFHKDLTCYIKSLNRSSKRHIKFLFIPELHSDKKSWHIHGFISGLLPEDLKKFAVGDIMGKSIADRVLLGKSVYSWLGYSNKFGYCDLEPISNAEAVSKYITKYINKDLAHSVTDLNAHLYYHSRGLKTAEIIKKGTMSANIAPDFSNEYCDIVWLDYTEQNLRYIADSFLDIDYSNTITL